MRDETRRNFIKNVGRVGVGGFLCPNILSPYDKKEPELLYNGIILPKPWPPPNRSGSDYEPMQIPYLSTPPSVIPVDVGRQLFVDDFLIEKTDLDRIFHKPGKYKGNPIFKSQTKLENGRRGLPVACPKDGGIWWDSRDQLFKMWYEAGWLDSMAYAISKDGINWIRPKVNTIKGNNQILEKFMPDSNTVWLDHYSNNEDERFKMFLRQPDNAGKKHGYVLTSKDGISWNEVGESGECGDRSTIFYNPFRKKWIYSIRSYTRIGRSRSYWEDSDFKNGADWDSKKVFWMGADRLDTPDPEIGDPAQLYNFSAVAYESLFIGFHQIHLGPANEICELTGIPKLTELKLSFSRDGFHWHRPNRDAFIGATRDESGWDRGYIQSVGGLCTLVDEKIRFYYTGFQGDSTKLERDGYLNGMYANGALGMAELRRDGFASMNSLDQSGSLTTRMIKFSGSYLFVNVNCPEGSLKVEVLDSYDTIISGFSQKDCEDVSVDSTKHRIKWNSFKDLSSLRGKSVKLRFILHTGDLYSFWISNHSSGASNGYIAAGGPDYSKDIDDSGIGKFKKY